MTNYVTKSCTRILYIYLLVWSELQHFLKIIYTKSIACSPFHHPHPLHQERISKLRVTHLDRESKQQQLEGECVCSPWCYELCLSTEAVEDELSCRGCTSVGSTESSAPPMHETPASSRRQDPERSSAQ